MLTADRCVLNMLEHMGPCLGLLWLHALCVDPSGATVAGSRQVASRAAYPLLRGSTVPARLPLRLLIATYSGYAIQMFLAVALVLTVCR